MLFGHQELFMHIWEKMFCQLLTMIMQEKKKCSVYIYILVTYFLFFFMSIIFQIWTFQVI